jgi:hypothetical protein
MELSRQAEDSDDVAILSDTRIVPPTEGVTIWWDNERATDPGYVAVGVSGAPLAGSPRYGYEVLLEADELGELLSYLPARAIPAVVDRWLAHGDPEAIGAVVGRIIAYLARARGTAGEQGGRSG